ncbi:Synaptojanin-1 [Dactylella cylindrospora]|nr:Synaptojanin-1 [Dactylella cylindrospora]
MTSLFPYRDINIHAAATYYAFTSPSNPSAPTLVVDRPSGHIWFSNKPMTGGKRVTSIAGILGMIRLRLDKYLIVITKATQVGRIKEHPVYKIQATEFLPLREKKLHDSDEDNYMRLLTTHLRTGPMYFSYSFDLTNTFQRQVHADQSIPLWQRADTRFFWNRYLSSDLIDLSSTSPAVNPYILPVIFGMMSITATAIKSTPISFILITRRSRFRAGTRYFSRGIDENGNVSNFNETEQIVITGSVGAGFDKSTASQEKQLVQIMSYVQTRGSVPVFWAEVNNLKFVPKLLIRNVDPAKAAIKHFAEQVRLYGDNYCVNLVNQSGREKNVKDAYESVLRNIVTNPIESEQAGLRTEELLRVIEPSEQRNILDHVRYVYFDFHHECRGLKFHRALLLLDKLGEALEKQKYFYATEGPGGLTVKDAQTSVVRTNCMDCLDRTNVVQGMLARWTLNKQLVELGILNEGETIDQYPTFEFLFRNVWADNADVVSCAYSGTGALKTDFTRTGKRTVNGAISDGINSLTRYYLNNFQDGPRQDAYDLFLGTYLPATSGIVSSLMFVDRRPVFIQSIPYILLGALIFLFAAMFTNTESSSVYPLRFFIGLSSLIAIWCAFFIKNHGMLYVNWPKLNNLTWANEGYNDALGKVAKDRLIGKWVARHERGASSIRLMHLEEGKKRIE